MRKPIALLACALSLPLALAACRHEEPVARLAVDTTRLDLPHGRHATLQLRFTPLRALPEGAHPTVFVHLLDAQRNVLRTFDHDLHGDWKVGSDLADPVGIYHSAIGPALPAGDYQLTAGIHEGKNRYPLTVEGGEASSHMEYPLATVHVTEAAGEPGFTFSPEWLPVEPGGDRQTVARRWLSRAGTLEIHGVPAPARLWMVLRLPRIEPPLRLMLDPGTGQPMATVKEDCGGFSATVTGEGFHELAIPVQAGTCRIQFTSNFVALEMGSGRKLTVAVEQLGWDPAAAGAPATP